MKLPINVAELTRDDILNLIDAYIMEQVYKENTLDDNYPSKKEEILTELVNELEGM